MPCFLVVRKNSLKMDTNGLVKKRPSGLKR